MVTTKADNLLEKVVNLYDYNLTQESCRTVLEVEQFIKDLRSIMLQYHEDSIAEGMSPGWHFSREDILSKIERLVK